MTFTILICRLLTSLSLRAPVSRPSFAFSDPKIRHMFSGRNTSRTWARTSQGSTSPDFPLSPVAGSICPITRQHSLFPNSHCRHSNSMPRGLPAMLCTWRRDSLSTFHINYPMSHLGAPWTPVVQRFRAGTLETCNLTTCSLRKERTFDLSHLVGL